MSTKKIGIIILFLLLTALPSIIWYNWFIRYTWAQAYPQCYYGGEYVTLLDVTNKKFISAFNNIITHTPDGRPRRRSIFKEENGIAYIKRFYLYYDDNFIHQVTTHAVSEISENEPRSNFFSCYDQYEILYGDPKHVPEMRTPWFYEKPDFVRALGFNIEGELNGNPSFLSKIFQYFHK
jgi:hypothetical protein